jgi:antirestriction protein ArdC
MNFTTKNANVRSDRQDVYTRVTQKIIADLEHGVRPWLKPWSDGRDDEGKAIEHEIPYMDRDLPRSMTIVPEGEQ